ncbi:MAG: aminotransferase class I/II-fold pyridoxal phosphate-dependent enzyme [Acidimicrobiia bacterium]|nr:aminotransferase class I/II-fold pyridoxal phosphate-dependent enzyme [Acidimicrobiia bacterium]MYC57930.1 aminotransferase class I/II-fold pyridoxal phosphate-dependent enzyme [Acidimicrobiia bacterium]MYG94926.1 aminotransferase class I/II-fold pyridoxal phosphate-dependent enzyme [Acidimicrobiia bacterium]MYI31233.1 aminotransferase class I/II-fold pyridoxal phosphate-dependent enzyme [Acidimicrobiia bacterium]
MADVPSAGPHGGDGPHVARALGIDPGSILDLSQSLNAFAPNLNTILTRHLDSLRRYPDPTDAAELLADAIGVDPQRLILTTGGSEAIWLVAQEIGGRVRAEPEFGLHPRNLHGPVWRSDPHNPSGHLADPEATADVWDEAFYPLATGRWTTERSSIVVGSLTKVFACPGLRIGYIIADDVKRFARQQPRWSVNSLALAMLPELLNLTDLHAWSKAIATARKELAELLNGFGLAVKVGDAPWVLVRAPGLRERLAPHGVVVRDCLNFGMSEYVRIGVPDSDGLARLESAMLLSGAKAKSG